MTNARIDTNISGGNFRKGKPTGRNKGEVPAGETLGGKKLLGVDLGAKGVLSSFRAEVGHNIKRPGRSGSERR